MAHDLIIRNGTVIDGSGGEVRRADVAVDGDRITAIGDLSAAEATRQIDASGLTVTPGFVDLHTHLDAQVGWDPYMTSSSWHGVTTVLMGNCGVTFAPVVPEHRRFLAEMMESVEDIPRDAILDGLPWDWSSYGEYLDSVQLMRPALNVVGLVGHCAVRYGVMGERALSDEAPTSDEMGRMAELVTEAVEDGAVGFSTSRILLHRVPDGRCVPGTFAEIDEYLAFGDAMNEAGGGLFQAVLDFETKASHEFQLLHAMADRCGDVLFSGGVRSGATEDEAKQGVHRFNQFLEATRADIGRITSAAMTRPSGTLVGLAQVPPVRGAAWKELMSLPTVEDRVAALREPAARAALLAEGEQNGTWYDPNHIYPLGTGEFPDWVPGRSVADHAAALRVHPVEFIIDRLLDSDGHEMFNTWFFNRNPEALGDFLMLDAVYPGLSDTGAHAGQICDTDASTHLLSYWSRDRSKISLVGAIRELTAKPAAVLGLVDRGTLEVGNFADINVFDPATLNGRHPEYRTDFPGGAGRLLIRSTGYAATIVNGAVVTEQGEHTGERPGRVIREFARG